MSNICSRCGHLIDYSLVSWGPRKINHCHFCIREAEALAERLDRDRKEAEVALAASVKEKLDKWKADGGRAREMANTNLDKFACIHCGYVYVRHQLRETFCDNCDEILKVVEVVKEIPAQHITQLENKE